MSLTMFQVSVPAFLRALGVLSTLLDKGEQHAAAHGIAPDVLLDARLAGDMLPLTGQIQRVSDTAKFCVARLCGIDAPRFDDDEASFQQLRERIASTVAFLKSVNDLQFAGSETREIRLTFGAFSVSVLAMPY